MEKPNVWNPQIVAYKADDKIYYVIKYFDLDSYQMVEGYGSYDFNIVMDYYLNYINVICGEATWIPCSTFKPKVDKTILICACGHRCTATYEPCNHKYYTDDGWYDEDKVTHWLPVLDVPFEEGIS